MRAVLQRVRQASVAIAGQLRGQIGPGLLVLVAVEEADMAEDSEWLSGKIVRLRIFPDDAGLMNRSVQEIGGEILLISQFTLFASTKLTLATDRFRLPVNESKIYHRTGKASHYLGTFFIGQAIGRR